MDKKAATGDSPRRNCDSSLTESWNIVDSPEVNNGSEGSDGESIEVIDEEAHHEVPDSTEEAEVGDEAGHDCSCGSETLEKNKVSGIARQQSSQDLNIPRQTKNERIELINAPRNTRLRQTNHGSGFYQTLLISVITVSLFYMLHSQKAEHEAGQTKNLIAKTPSDPSNDYQEMLEQLRAYKEESKGLKDLVTDLNAAVMVLKQELATKSSRNDNQGPQILPSNEDLFEQLLQVHTNSFQNSDDSSEQVDHAFKIVEDMAKSLTDGKEGSENMEVIKLFYEIPKHLEVLSRFQSPNDHMLSFINAWKVKLGEVNDHLVDDMKTMQLKMIRHIVKHLKKAENGFFNGLCNLKNIKKQECYDTFLKNFKGADDNLPVDEDLKDNLFGSSSEDIDDQHCLKSGSGQGANIIYGKEETYISTDEGGVKDEFLKLKTLKENKGHADDSGKQKNIIDAVKKECSKGKRLQPPPRLQGSGPPLKGMDSEIEEEMKIDDQTNLFSSFSQINPNTAGKGGQKEATYLWDPRSKEQRRKTKVDGSQESEEDSWFLRLGRHRSNIRYLSSRGDWLFDRARFRRGRASSYHL